MISRQEILDFFTLSTPTIYCRKGLEGRQNFSNPLIPASNPDGLICGTPQTPPHTSPAVCFVIQNPAGKKQAASCTINLNAWNKICLFLFPSGDLSTAKICFEIFIQYKTWETERKREREGRLAGIQLVDLSHQLLLFFVQGKVNASVPHLS